jgi:carbon-monoxide dehydrogenase large subunit
MTKRSLSPWRSLILSNGTPSLSLKTWANGVACPMPKSNVPVISVTVPSALNSICASSFDGGATLPPGAPQSLDVTHISDGPGAPTFPNGCHVAEVEVDSDTGVVEVVKYACVNDFGIVVNPLVVAGQLHGGVVQGIGQALMEMTVYDDDGQLLTGSFLDYAMPRAMDAPPFVLADHPVPAKTNPLGVKGCGEAGCAGALTSVMNAVMNALAERGVRHVDMPLTPFRIWQALHNANGTGAENTKQ